MELAMIRANIEEDQETTIARFVSGLNPEIADTVELQYYVDLEEVVHLAMKAEKQLKRKGTSRNHFSTSKWSQNSKWGPNTSKTPYKAYQTPIKPSQTKGDVGISKSQEPLDMNRGKQTVTPSRNRDIQCFKCLGRGHIASQCPNRHTMVIRESGEIETDSEKEEEDDTIEEEVNENVDFPADGEVLVVCFVIIDGGSCTNVASILMVQKLGLKTTKHPHPYKDEVLCDVVPMHATHMLLGRPWQFDRKVMHDGYSNRYSFTYDGKKHTLAPLSPQQVHDGQVHFKKSFEEFKEKEQKTVKIEIEQKNERENEVKAKRKGNGMSEIVSRGENRKMSVFARGTVCCADLTSVFSALWGSKPRRLLVVSTPGEASSESQPLQPFYSDLGFGDQFDRLSAQSISSRYVPLRTHVVTRTVLELSILFRSNIGSCTAVERSKAGAQ
ncbi:hypothetical protein GQ457_05G027360 [Hibiscus cannabinus]